MSMILLGVEKEILVLGDAKAPIKSNQIIAYLIQATWPITRANTHTHTDTHTHIQPNTQQTQKTDTYIEESESNKTITVLCM